MTSGAFPEKIPPWRTLTSAESLSRDFRELYLLRPDELPDQDGALLAADGDQPRRDDRAVQHLRKRMCYELNFATSSLYRTARYLARASMVHQHLSGGGSSLAPADQEGLDRLIAEVGTGLQGATRAGIFLEQQESIAEMMVDADGRVLSHFDFRRRLLEVPGWEQFTALFLFFITENDQPDGPHARARGPGRGRRGSGRARRRTRCRSRSRA
jgi:hypothetical protein